jgi:hypothetical protein
VEVSCPHVAMILAVNRDPKLPEVVFIG